ncbi:MAG: DMT family transporter [Promethearchaeota archaeon]
MRARPGKDGGGGGAGLDLGTGEGHHAARGYALVFLAVTTWSFSEILQKLLQGDVLPMSLSFLRFFIGTVPLLLVMAVKRDFRGVGGMLRRNWKTIAFASLVAFSLSNFVYFSGIRLTKANVGSAIYTSYPIFVSIYSISLLGERDNLQRKFNGYALGFAGIAILVTQFDLQGFIDADDLPGNALVLLGAALFGFYSVLGKKVQSAEREAVPDVQLKFTTVSMALAAAGNLAVLLVVPAFSAERATLFQYDLRAWTLIIVLGVVSTGVGMYLFFLGVREIEVSRGMSVAMLKPVLTTAFAFLILGELPTVALVVSIPIVAAAVIVVARPGGRNDGTLGTPPQGQKAETKSNETSPEARKNGIE